MDHFYMEVPHAKGNGLKALGAKHNNQVLIDQGERLLAASTKHQTVTDWSREGARAMEEELTKRKTHNTAHGRILKCDPNFTDEFTKLVEGVQDEVLGKGIRFTPERIFNADEIHFQTNPEDPNARQIDYVSNGHEPLLRANDGDKHCTYHTSIMITSNASGLKYPEVPPWQVFHDNPGEGGKFPATNTLKLDPELMLATTQSGLMTPVAFRAYSESYIFYTKTRPDNKSMLFLDAHYSHLDYESLTYLTDNGCTVIFLVSKIVNLILIF